ncbi:ABC transporter substrate-binding protein [Paenibacillus aceti]|uniref:Sugar ABC transporter substrate-binding protein n=1 Tax=Paenibacillus aceti TaxID=1820010 RepID=A0ABQ1W5X6_9BACL|nr:ABC transporter substrate-binding protein [Paenibacillus aceti]GGG16679.1 sugar ABC transporter substrate-binding protein [Paenibacillus aceti]
MKNVRKPAIFCLIATIFAVFVLSGCSDSKNAGSTDGTGGKDEQVKLVFWSHQADAFIKSYRSMIDQYEQEHPNVKIDFQNYPYDAYNQKLKASFSANHPPDMAEVFGTWVPEYSNNGLLAEVPDGENRKEEYFEAPLGGYMHDGKLYGLPMEYNIENGGMLIHSQMFKDKGIAYPLATWPELVEAAKQLTVTSGDSLKVKGFDFVSGDNITFTFLSFILQQKGDYWGENGHVNFQTPEAVKAMTELKNLIVEDKVADLTTFGGQLDTSDYFFKGGSAMAYRGPWTIATGLDSYKVDDFEYVPVPSYTSEPPLFAAESGWGLVVSQKSKHAEEAWDFINYVTSKEQLRKWNLDTFTVPAKKEVASDPEFVKENPYMKTSIDILEYGRWIGPIWDRDYLFKQINDHFQLIVAGKITVEDGLRKIEEAVNTSQDQHK